MMQPRPPRYAIYFTPEPGAPLATFGVSVIGYDANVGRDAPHLPLRAVPVAELASATQAPRRYGFHATLAAPFYLNGVTEENFVCGLDAFCDQTGPARLGRLAVSAVDDFVALTPVEECPEIDTFAARCVEFFDRYRAPLNAYDLARRSAEDLSVHERQHLARWGYPFVFDTFRFHMTLTGRLASEDRRRFQDALADAFRPIADASHRIESVSVMRQVAPDSRFEVIARQKLRHL